MTSYIRHNIAVTVIRIEWGWLCRFLPHRWYDSSWEDGERVYRCVRCKERKPR